MWLGSLGYSKALRLVAISHLSSVIGLCHLYNIFSKVDRIIEVVIRLDASGQVYYPFRHSRYGFCAIG